MKFYVTLTNLNKKTKCGRKHDFVPRTDNVISLTYLTNNIKTIIVFAVSFPINTSEYFHALLNLRYVCLSYAQGVKWHSIYIPLNF